MFAWDDTPGAGTVAQMQLQRTFVNNVLSLNYGTLVGVVPAAYLFLNNFNYKIYFS